MKIYFITNWLTKHHKHVGGGEQATYSILKLLKKGGKNVGVFFTKPDFDYKEFKTLHIKRMEEWLPSSLRKPIERMKILGIYYDKLTFLHSLKAYSKVKPDVINFQNFNVLSFPMLWAAKIMGIPTVFSVYDFWCVCPAGTLIDNRGKRCRVFNSTFCEKCNFFPPEFKIIKKLGLLKIFLFIREKIFKWSLNQFDAFIVLSTFWIDLLTRYGISEEKINVIPLPIEGKIRINKNRRIERNSILFVGWIDPRKGAHIVVHAMKKVLKKVPKAKLYVIGPTGDEKYQKMSEEYIKKNKLDGNVKLLGRMPHQEVLDFMQKVEVITIPEQWEIAWPIALTEAMAVAKPTVASNIGGIPDFIDIAENGFLAEATDVDDFADKIIWLLKNKSKAKKMGVKARKDILKITNENALVEKLMNLYKSLS
jgi:glycosyltransferase involved in cell wall biosynthesis